MFNWNVSIGDIVIGAGLIFTFLSYRNDQQKKHDQNVQRLARIEADLGILMEFYRNWVKDFFKREP